MRPTISAAALVLAATATAPASVAVTTSYNDWQAAAGPQITQLTFQGIGPGGTGFNNQYASFGVTDPEGNDVITLDTGIWTLQSMPFGPPTVTFQFGAPLAAVGWSAPHNQTAALYLGGELVASNIFMPGGPPSTGWTFSGLVSDLAFDNVVIAPMPFGNAVVDDLWFPTIPAPPALAVAALAALGSRRRRTVS